MSHIMLTKACNLNCPYCFANEFVNKQSSYMSMEDFNTAKEFLLTGGPSIGLIGGEPTTHPLILDIMQNIIDDNRIAKSTIFTNGINFDKIVYKFTNEKFGTLINVNSKEVMGDAKYNKMLANMDMLHNQFSVGHRVSFGYNIHGTNFDYQYIIDLCKKYNKKELRISICVPNSPEHKNLKSLEWFRLVRPAVFEFFQALYDNEIVPHYDCNYLPICVPTMEDKELLLKIHNMARDNGFTTNLLSTCSTCDPVIDILPDLQAVRCFGMSDHLKADISQFNNVSELNNYFSTEIDSYKYITVANPECEACYKRKVQDCIGGCLAYKDALVHEARERMNALNNEVKNGN